MFLPPGFLTDLTTTKGKEAWSGLITEKITEAIAQRDKALAPDPFLVTSDTKVTTPSDAIQWAGEPRRFFKYIKAPPQQILEFLDWTGSDGLQYGRAMTHEEYLEWRTVRGADGRIASVEMTCESIEYWSVLAQYEPRAMMALVAQFTGIAESKINLVDLFGTSKPFTDPDSPDGMARRLRFVSRNRHTNLAPCVNNYNNGTLGMLHMGVSPNALAAAITLAVWAAYPLEFNGRAMSGEEATTTGTQNVQSCRSSDPSIAEKIISIVHKGRRVGLANPIGIYMVPFPRALIRLDGADLPEDWLAYSRGSAPRLDSGNNQTYQRLVIKPPKGSKKSIEDLVDQNGNPVRGGAQLARLQNVTILSQTGTTVEPVAPLKLPITTPSKCDQKHPDAATLQSYFDLFRSQTAPGINMASLDVISRTA